MISSNEINIILSKARMISLNQWRNIVRRVKDTPEAQSILSRIPTDIEVQLGLCKSLPPEEISLYASIDFMRENHIHPWFSLLWLIKRNKYNTTELRAILTIDPSHLLFLEIIKKQSVSMTLLKWYCSHLKNLSTGIGEDIETWALKIIRHQRVYPNDPVRRISFLEKFSHVIQIDDIHVSTCRRFNSDGTPYVSTSFLSALISGPNFDDDTASRWFRWIYPCDQEYMRTHKNTRNEPLQVGDEQWNSIDSDGFPIDFTEEYMPSGYYLWQNRYRQARISERGFIHIPMDKYTRALWHSILPNVSEVFRQKYAHYFNSDSDE